MKKKLSMITIGLLVLSMFSMFMPWTVEAQEIVWNTNPTPLPTPTTMHASIVHNGRIYVIGGRIDGVPYVEVPNVYFADINPNGTVESWTETTPLPEQRRSGTAVVWNDFVYVIAGSGPTWAGRSEQNTVFCANIRSDGTIGDWTLDPNRVPERLVSHVAVVWNGRIYVVGGWNGYSSQDEIYYADINSVDGSLGSWNENPIPLPFRWESMCALVHNGVISLIGGWHGGTGPPHDKVSCAPIETDGTVGLWDEKTSLPETRALPSCALIDDDIYVVGGYSWDESPYQAEKTVYRAEFCIGDWTEVQSVPEARVGHSVVTFDGRIYVLGGHDWDEEYIEKDTIYYSSLAPVPAAIDITPNTLNLKSKGEWTTCYIKLPEGYNVSDIDVSTILLNGAIPVDLGAPIEVGDHDGDGVPDLMVKFDRAGVASYILANVNMTQLSEERFMKITLTITGYLNDDTPFEGSDAIRIMLPGGKGAGKRTTTR